MMQAVTVKPGSAKSTVVGEVPEPPTTDGDVEVRGLLLGICGTDADIVNNGYGWAPPGSDRLIIGHESLGEVVSAPKESGLEPGDLVVGIVRRPDPVPCEPCSRGEWDFCQNGRYVERGIKERNGYGSQRWRVEHDFAIKVDPKLGHSGVLVEPTSVVAKAWEQTDRIFERYSGRPKVALITGAGPIGLLGGLLGRQRGLDVHIFDQSSAGPKAQLSEAIGATFHTGDLSKLGIHPDVVIECTGFGPLVFELSSLVNPGAVICLAGISSGARTVSVAASEINKEMVLENTVMFGSVNAARRHYEQAADSLSKADPAWLEGLITKSVPMADYGAALDKSPNDVKVVVDLTQGK